MTVLIPAFVGAITWTALVTAASPPIAMDVPDRAKEIHATAWLNAQPVRMFESPKAILLVFQSGTSPAVRRLTGYVNALQKRYDDGRLLVVGLTDDPLRDTRRLVLRERLRYKFGAGASRSFARYEVKTVPTVVLIDPAQHRAVFRAEGDAAEPRAVAKAVADLIGAAEGSDRFARRAAEEKADQSLMLMRAARNEDRIVEIVNQILEINQTGALIEPEDTQPLLDFYEAHLPSDPDGSCASSDNLARSFLFSGTETGYGTLFAKGKLSEAAQEEVRDAAIDALYHDPAFGVRLSAARTLARVVGRVGDATLLDALRERLATEPESGVRGSIQYALDRLDPEAPAEVKARAYALRGRRLRKMLAGTPDPATSVWAEAHRYMQGVGQRDNDTLLADYWGATDTDDTVGRQNAILKRYAAVRELRRRTYKLPREKRSKLCEDFKAMVESESDPDTRRAMLNEIYEFAEGTTGDERSGIVSWMRDWLLAEPDPYQNRSSIELMIEILEEEAP